MSADIEGIKDFLIDANQAGYGNPEVEIQSMEDGGKMITFSDESYYFSDYFYGGHPYSGQEVVYEGFDHGKPVWAMQYRGWVFDTEMTPNADWTVKNGTSSVSASSNIRQRFITYTLCACRI